MFQPQRDQYLEEAHAWRTSEEVRNSLSGLSERGTHEAWRERPTIMKAVMRWEAWQDTGPGTLRLAGLPCGRCPLMGQSWQD